MKKDILDYFRLIAFIEGVSYLALLLIAMPLKYVYGYPEAVKVVGMAHGVLFIGFVLLLALSGAKYRFSIALNVVFFIASLVPFGTFIMDRKIKQIQYLSI